MTKATLDQIRKTKKNTRNQYASSPRGNVTPAGPLEQFLQN